MKIITDFEDSEIQNSYFHFFLSELVLFYLSVSVQIL
jgi:hypothetical protein